MELPPHEQFRNDQWRRMITAAGPGDLEALRTAVKVGIADFEQGRHAAFESGAQLRAHLASVAAKAIAGA